MHNLFLFTFLLSACSLQVSAQTTWITAIVYGKTVSWESVHTTARATSADRPATTSREITTTHRSESNPSKTHTVVVVSTSTSHSKKHKTETSSSESAIVIATSSSSPTISSVTSGGSTSAVATDSSSSSTITTTSSSTSAAVLVTTTSGVLTTSTSPTDPSSSSGTTSATAVPASTLAATAHAASSNSKALAIGLGVGIPLFVILCGVLAFFCLRRNKKQKQVRDSFQFLENEKGSQEKSRPSDMVDYQPNREPTLPVLAPSLNSDLPEMAGDGLTAGTMGAASAPAGESYHEAGAGQNPFMSASEANAKAPIVQEPAELPAFRMSSDIRGQGDSKPWLPPAFMIGRTGSKGRSQASNRTAAHHYPSDNERQQFNFGLPGSRTTQPPVRGQGTALSRERFNIPRRPVPGA